MWPEKTPIGDDIAGYVYFILVPSPSGKIVLKMGHHDNGGKDLDTYLHNHWKWNYTRLALIVTFFKDEAESLENKFKKKFGKPLPIERHNELWDYDGEAKRIVEGLLVVPEEYSRLTLREYILTRHNDLEVDYKQGEGRSDWRRTGDMISSGKLNYGIQLKNDKEMYWIASYYSENLFEAIVDGFTMGELNKYVKKMKKEEELKEWGSGERIKSNSKKTSGTNHKLNALNLIGFLNRDRLGGDKFSKCVYRLSQYALNFGVDRFVKVKKGGYGFYEVFGKSGRQVLVEKIKKIDWK